MPDKDHVLTPGVPRLFGQRLGKIEPVSLPIESYYPDHRPFVADRSACARRKRTSSERKRICARNKKSMRQSRRSLANASLAAGYEKLRAISDQLALAKKTLAAAKEYLPALEARIAADKAKFADPPDPAYETLALAARKAERKAGILKADENVLRAQLDFNEALQQRCREREEDRRSPETTGRGSEGADPGARRLQHNWQSLSRARVPGAVPLWRAGSRLPTNPLTARVAINHMWLRHFGKPLVPTVFDFGMNGKPPSNPQLLDWLATEFVKSGWSMKAIHRLMVTSSAYRRRSTAGEANHPNVAIDPENRVSLANESAADGSGGRPGQRPVSWRANSIRPWEGPRSTRPRGSNRSAAASISGTHPTRRWSF